MKTVKHTALATIGAAALAQALVSGPAMAAGQDGQGRGNNDQLGTIYVSGQGLYYDTFKTTDLPPRGRFQPLDPTGADNAAGVPSTPYGPGDHGYVGGRWWIDTNLDGEMDDMDVYFSCPLLGPGRIDP